jgi:23S rRNA (guanosine2251-2'-O)-methyltransferase
VSLIAGRNPVMEALRAGTLLERIVIQAGVSGEPVERIRNLARERGIPLAEIDRERFRSLAGGAAAQGVIAFTAGRKAATLDELLAVGGRMGERGFLLLLDEIEDPQNLGALIRTAECAGVHGVVIPRHRAVHVTPAVVKASAGASEHLPLAEVTNLVAAIERVKEEGYWVIGLDAGGDRPYTAVDYTTPVALVVGSEGKGLRRLVRERCDVVVTIPLRGRISSLNASVAGALVMYEVVRARSGPAPSHTS